MKVIQLNQSKLSNHINSLSGLSCKILLYLSCLTDETNEIQIKVTRFLDDLNIKKPSLNSSLKELKENKIIGILSYDGRSYRIRIALNDEEIESHIKEYIQEKLF